jgi:hypothetical protein
MLEPIDLDRILNNFGQTGGKCNVTMGCVWNCVGVGVGISLASNSSGGILSGICCRIWADLTRVGLIPWGFFGFRGVRAIIFGSAPIRYDMRGVSDLPVSVSNAGNLH